MITKKMNKKAAASLILALILCLAVFASGCGGNNVPAQTTQNVDVTPEPEANVTPEPQNFGGFTVVIPDNGKYQIATDNDFVERKIAEDIVKEKGIYVDINVLPLDSTDYIGQINAVIAGGQSVECIVDDYSSFDVYVNVPNLCVPIDSLLVEYGQNLLNSISSDRWDAVTFNNQVYAVPGAGLPESTAMYVRQDILRMIMGMDTIVTREEFNAALRAFSTLKDVTPLAVNYEQALDYMSYLTHSPSNDYVYEYGKYVMREQHGYFDDFLELLKEYYEDGYLPQDFFDLSKQQVSEMFTSGLAMMYVTEYTNVADEYSTLLSQSPTAEVSLVTKPTHRRMAYVELSGETPVSDICLFTSYGQNHQALMVYLDWLLSDVENYETAKLGVLGTQINFNNMAHEYQLIGEYEQKTDFYNGIFGLGIDHDGTFAPVYPINGDANKMKYEKLRYDSYAHLSTAAVVDEGTYTLSENAKAALAYYRFSMDEAIRKYVTGEIDHNAYLQYLYNNDANADVVLGELNTMQPNGTRK